MRARVLVAVCVLVATATGTTSSAPATGGSAQTTGSAVLTMGTDALNTSNSLLPSPTIPPGYEHLTTGSYYKLHRRLVTWNVANTTCASEGAHLLVLNDAEEADIINHFVVNATGDWYNAIWTGLQYNQLEGVMEWRTINGESLNDVFHVWGEGRPYNVADRTCAIFGTYNNKLFDDPCNWVFFYICEIKV